MISGQTSLQTNMLIADLYHDSALGIGEQLGIPFESDHSQLIEHLNQNYQNGQAVLLYAPNDRLVSRLLVGGAFPGHFTLEEQVRYPRLQLVTGYSPYSISEESLPVHIKWISSHNDSPIPNPLLVELTPKGIETMFANFEVSNAIDQNYSIDLSMEEAGLSYLRSLGRISARRALFIPPGKSDVIFLEIASGLGFPVIRNRKRDIYRTFSFSRPYDMSTPSKINVIWTLSYNLEEQ